jgi:hypothetical protein
MSKLTLVHRDEVLHLYWHEEHAYYLADWQPVFRKGETLKRAYQPEFTKAGVRCQIVVQAEKAVGKLSTHGAAKGIWKSGNAVSVHPTRAQAEAAIVEWLEKRASG